jgi:hypothetical protein
MANRITPLAMTMMMSDRDDIKSPKEEKRKKEGVTCGTTTMVGNQKQKTAKRRR